jgi:hypothetical protein
MNTDELRKLAEAAISNWKHMVAAGTASSCCDTEMAERAFRAAASPARFLALLDRIEELDEGRKHLMAEVEKWQQTAEQNMLDYQEMYRERDAARAAVKRLAGELRRLSELVCDIDGTLIDDALSTPVVRRIVEE